MFLLVENRERHISRNVTMLSYLMGRILMLVTELRIFRKLIKIKIIIKSLINIFFVVPRHFSSEFSYCISVQSSNPTSCRKVHFRANNIHKGTDLSLHLQKGVIQVCEKDYSEFKDGWYGASSSGKILFALKNTVYGFCGPRLHKESTAWKKKN